MWSTISESFIDDLFNKTPFVGDFGCEFKLGINKIVFNQLSLSQFIECVYLSKIDNHSEFKSVHTGISKYKRPQTIHHKISNICYSTM